MADARSITRAFDADENRTRLWDAKGNFAGYEPGNTEKYGSGPGPIQPDALMPGAGKDPPVLRTADGKIDWKKTTGSWLEDLIPAAITAAAPELRIPGMANLTPLKQVISKMGLSTALQTAVDQVVDSAKGGNKPLLNSALGAAGNSILGIGVPEMMPGIRNVGIDMPGMSKNTSIQRSNSGSSKTASQSSTDSGPVMAPGPPTYVPGIGPGGSKLFGTMQAGPPQPTGQFTSSTTGTSSTSSGGTGNTAINREINTPGWMGHIMDLLKNIESYKTTSSAKLSDQQRALKSALIGLGINMETDKVKQ